MTWLSVPWCQTEENRYDCTTESASELAETKISGKNDGFES